MGVKSLYPTTPITIIFQPHLYSRTQDFYTEFAQSLSLAQTVILLPIYPARELPIEGVNSAMILKEITTPNKHLYTKEEMKHWILQHKPSLIVMAGAGDIDVEIQAIKNILEN